MGPAAACMGFAKSASRDISFVDSNGTGLLDIAADLLNQGVEAFEFLFRTKKFQKANFDVLSVNVAIEVEQMNFKNALRFCVANGWSNTEVDHSAMDLVFDLGLCRINA